MTEPQGIGLYIHDVLKSIFNLGLSSDTYEPILFKLIVTIGDSKLHNVITD